MDGAGAPDSIGNPGWLVPGVDMFPESILLERMSISFQGGLKKLRVKRIIGSGFVDRTGFSCVQTEKHCCVGLQGYEEQIFPYDRRCHISALLRSFLANSKALPFICISATQPTRMVQYCMGIGSVQSFQILLHWPMWAMSQCAKSGASGVKALLKGNASAVTCKDMK